MGRWRGLVGGAVVLVASLMPGDAALGRELDLGGGEVQWTARDFGSSFDSSAALAVSPDGATVYVAGLYGVAARQASSGALEWVVKPMPQDTIYLHDLAVSPDGTTLFLTGDMAESIDTRSSVTAALDATSGALDWVVRFSVGAGNNAIPNGIDVAPDGSRVYVTGSRTGSGGIDDFWDYFTIGYEAGTGAEAWNRSFNGPGDGADVPTDIGASPDGQLVFVTGTSIGPNDRDFGTVAYRAEDGSTAWAAPHGGLGDDYANALDVTPNGRAVFVTGTTGVFTGSDRLALVAYRAQSGARIGAAGYDGGSFDSSHDVEAAPDGSGVYITGGTGDDFITIAYAASGALRWVATNDSGKGADSAVDLAVSPGGDRVYVTGIAANGFYCFGFEVASNDYATVAYDASTGAALWAARYVGLNRRSYDAANEVAVSPDGLSTFVTGSSDQCGSDADAATVSYAA